MKTPIAYRAPQLPSTATSVIYATGYYPTALDTATTSAPIIFATLTIAATAMHVNCCRNVKSGLCSDPSTHRAIAFSSAVKSKTPCKSAVTPFAFVKTPPGSPLPAYRSVSPPPGYQSIKPQSFLTIDDLFIRYVPLTRVRKQEKKQEKPVLASAKPPRELSVSRVSGKRRLALRILPAMTIQDLYQRFGKQEKMQEKLVLSASRRQSSKRQQRTEIYASSAGRWTPGSPINQRTRILPTSGSRRAV